MASWRTACCLLAAALCLRPAWAARAYGGGGGGGDAREPGVAAGVVVGGASNPFNQNAVAPSVTVAAAAPQIDTAPPSEITAAPRPLLLYIPFHVSEPASHIADLCDCTFRRQPWRGRAAHAFDVLLSISGLKSAGNEAALKAMLEDAVAHVVPRPRVFVEFVQLRSDRYVLDVDESQKDDSWVSGPNTAFYDAFLDGHIFHKFVRHYRLVQQLETDVCALTDGWLDDLTKPADNGNVLISGATIRGDCIYIKKHDRCESSQDLEDHMRHHVNGNALYRISPDLATVLAQAKTAFHNSEPFDLAIYWVMKAKDMQSKLHSNPIYLNLASLVDTAQHLDRAYYGGTATVVHVPRRLRTCEFRAVATRGFVGLPLTVITVHGQAEPSLARLVKSLERLQIDRFVLLATSEPAFVALSKTYPFRVLAAFAKAGAARETTASTKNPLQPAGTAPYKPSLLLPGDDRVACAPWTREGASPTSHVLTAAGRLVRMGYAPFVVDQHALIMRDFELALFQTPADGVYVTSSGANWSPAAAGRDAAWLPPLMFFPRSEAVASTADAMAALADAGMQGASLPALKTFAPDQVADGGPFHDLAFPLTLRSRRLVRLPDANLPAYDVWQSRAKVGASVKLQCANYTVAGRRSLDVGSADAGAVVRAVVDAVSSARARSVACVVLPSLVFRRRSAASIFKIVDVDALAGLAGDKVTLVPSVSNIDTERGVYVELAAEHSRKQAGDAQRRWYTADVRRVVSAADGVLGRDFVCVQTVGVSDTAFGLRRQVDGLQRALKAAVGSNKIFLRGAWRHLDATFWANATANVRPVTLAHVRAALDGGARAQSSSPAQPFGTTDAVALDEAWADLVESAVCSGAARTVNITLEQAKAPGPASLSGLSPTAVGSDLALFSAWLRRPDRQALRGPFLVLSGDAASPPASCQAWARTARQAVLLAHATKARHVVLPPVGDAWRAGVDLEGLHKALPNVLPAAVARLLQPGLTFGTDSTVTTPADRDADRLLTTKYAAELAFVGRTRKLLSARSVLWAANATDTAFNAMWHGLRSWDWVSAHVTASDNALLGAVLKRGEMMDGLAYQRRVDGVFGGVCGGGVVAALA